MPFYVIYYDDGSTALEYGLKPFTAAKPGGAEPLAVMELPGNALLIDHAPVLTIAESFAGRQITVDVTALEGHPVPTVSLTTATADGTDISGSVTATGTGPATQFTYTFADSAADIAYLFEVTATNSEGSDVESVSGTLTGNLPLQLNAPTLTGGAGTLTLDFTDAPGNSTRNITGYDYEIADSADTAFAAPTYSGTVASDVDVDFTSVPAGDYIARVRAVNAAGPGAWSAASSAATVT